MNILALDTAGKTAAVAVLRDDTLLYETGAKRRRWRSCGTTRCCMRPFPTPA